MGVRPEVTRGFGHNPFAPGRVIITLMARRAGDKLGGGCEFA